MKPDGYLTWDVDELAKALGIPVNAVLNMYTDGRKISYILEERFNGLFSGTLAGNCDNHDVLTEQGAKLEIRGFTRDYAYFCPSSMIGSSREFNQRKFEEKIHDVDYFIFCDQKQFPNVPYWIIPKSTVHALIEDGVIKRGRMTMGKMKEHLSSRGT